MPRERIATRDVVFGAADDLNRRGDKVSVAAVREVIGGGSNTTIHELLVEWRRQRRDRQQSVGNVVALNGTVPAMPDPLRALVDGFTVQLSRRWTEALSNSLGLDDQMAVIRAAAEARVREAETRAIELEDELDELRALLQMTESERDALQAVLDTAEERGLLPAPQVAVARLAPPLSAPPLIAPPQLAAPARALPEPQLPATDGRSWRWPPGSGGEVAHSAKPSPVQPEPLAPARTLSGNPIEDALIGRLEEELARALDERDSLAREVALLRAEAEARPDEGQLRHQATERQALEDAVKSAETARDLARAERDKLKDDMMRVRAAAAAMREEGERLGSERKRLQAEVMTLQERVERQNAWIAQARLRLEAAGLIKKKPA